METDTSTNQRETTVIDSQRKSYNPQGNAGVNTVHNVAVKELKVDLSYPGL